MSEITAAKVQELRVRTGAGIMACKRALQESGGDAQKAIEQMRLAGLAGAERKAVRTALEGLVFIDSDASGAVLLEVNCETDFAARSERFRSFVRELAVLLLEQRPADLEALLATPFPGADGRSVEQARQELVSTVGENVDVRRFTLYATSGQTHIGSYLHQDRIGVIVQMEGGDEELARNIAMHVSWGRPRYISRDQVPEQESAKEAEFLRNQAGQSGKPAAIVEQMVSGRLAKYLDGITLLGQGFVRDSEHPVSEVLEQAKARVQNFVCYEVGEGLRESQVPPVERSGEIGTGGTA